MLKKYFLLINFAIIGLFITAQSCQATYYCRCITEEKIVTRKVGKNTYDEKQYEVEKKSVTSLSVSLNDKEACVKYCKKNNFKGAMSPWVCKDNLCPTSKIEFADGNRNITMF
jgi:hypothetical protein